MQSRLSKSRRICARESSRYILHEPYVSYHYGFRHYADFQELLLLAYDIWLIIQNDLLPIPFEAILVAFASSVLGVTCVGCVWLYPSPSEKLFYQRGCPELGIG
ncbi:hypothetical protein TNCT_342401 [Trichonephila clavata]|uniref:Uncharacterized protein n=1 Tax=Trichonephila clavata TaxID=2740835 RepID=A0A8X6GEL4_TRICU|nr:hypothetical protein TNCT_342401 [Trichonephila clavata]